MSIAEEYIEKRVFEVIEDLLFHPECVIFSLRILKEKQIKDDVVAESIRAMNQAMVEDGGLKALVNDLA